MSSDALHGNLKGLAPAQLRALQKLYQRAVAPDEIVSLEVARELTALAEGLRRRLGLLINRQGRIVEVVVGTKEILYLPDLGRYRLGRARLRNLRLVFTDLSNQEAPAAAAIPYDIYADLERLRLDAVVSVRSAPNRIAATYAYLVPVRGAESAASQTESVRDLGAAQINFQELIADVEQQLAAEVVQLAAGDSIGAVMVGVYDNSSVDPETSIAELKELARSAGVTVVDAVIQKRRVDPKTYIGSGKLQELVLRCLRTGADMLIFDAELKPSQWRAITNSTELKVLDRSMLILDIFAQRAQSSDGRLQVELAQLRYNLPRLVEKDAGLSRLSGGIGGRGPGETKLEIGRRRTRDRISELERRLEKVRSSRDFRRIRRREQQLQVVSIVGYTNVGKSTLFNLLTGSSVTVENKLFATLDPSQRRLYLPPADPTVGPGRTVILSDTVGFIRSLPQELESAFRATLEELYEAALLVHVVDISDPDVEGKYRAVRRILEQMELRDLPELVVYNKIDRVDAATAAERMEATAERPGVAVSALQKLGIEELLRRIDVLVPSVAAGRSSWGSSVPPEGD